MYSEEHLCQAIQETLARVLVTPQELRTQQKGGEVELLSV
jgi:hypothetical protein